MSRWQLSGGRLPSWDAVRAAFGALTFQWQDGDGFHVAALPEVSPHTSLLHGWSTDRAVFARFRWDSGCAYAACLALDLTTVPRGLSGAGIVEPAIRRARSWGATGRVANAQAKLGTDQLNFDHELIEVPDLGEGVLVFIRPASA